MRLHNVRLFGADLNGDGKPDLRRSLSGRDRL